MNTLIAAAVKTVANLLTDGDRLLAELEAFGWKDERPERIEENRENYPIGLEAIFVTPAQVRVPTAFVEQYHQWYAGCLALTEANMPSRRGELVTAHTALDSLNSDYMTRESQLSAARNITHMKAIVSSIPHYLEGRLHDIELQVAQAYVGDQLAEAEVLLKARHVRAAGAIAGVLLERHLKLLCDRHQPSIKYTKTAGISKLNDLLRNASVYDIPQWRKVQWMGDIRNTCDHAGTDEPRRDDIASLIADVRRFVTLFVS